MSNQCNRRRAEAAKRNGASSKGPVTAEGKARSSRNALRHGLAARLHQALANNEDKAVFQGLREGLEADLRPQGVLEEALVHQLALAWWRLGRIDLVEAALFAGEADPFEGLASRKLSLVLRYRGQVQRMFNRTIDLLEARRKARERAARERLRAEASLIRGLADPLAGFEPGLAGMAAGAGPVPSASAPVAPEKTTERTQRPWETADFVAKRLGLAGARSGAGGAGPDLASASAVLPAGPSAPFVGGIGEIGERNPRAA